MNRRIAWFVGLGMWVVLMLLGSGGVEAGTPASESLEKCLVAVQKETAKLAYKTQKAMAACLQKIAKEVVRDNQSMVDVSGATNACLAQFYKIGRTDGKSLAAKMRAKVDMWCNPAHPSMKAQHTIDDVLGTGMPTVNQPLDVTSLDGYCFSFNGVGSSDLSDWFDCLEAAAECHARQQIAVSFPRALEWLALMDQEFTASTNPKKPAAQTALQEADSEIEGFYDDNSPELSCGPCDLSLSGSELD